MDAGSSARESAETGMGIKRVTKLCHKWTNLKKKNIVMTANLLGSLLRRDDKTPLCKRFKISKLQLYPYNLRKDLKAPYIQAL